MHATQRGQFVCAGAWLPLGAILAACTGCGLSAYEESLNSTISQAEVKRIEAIQQQANAGDGTAPAAAGAPPAANQPPPPAGIQEVQERIRKANEEREQRKAAAAAGSGVPPAGRAIVAPLE